MSPRHLRQPLQLGVLAPEGGEQVHDERGLSGDQVGQVVVRDDVRPYQFVGQWYLKTRDAATYYGYRSVNGFREWALKQGIQPVLRGGALLWDTRDVDAVLAHNHKGSRRVA